MNKTGLIDCKSQRNRPHPRANHGWYSVPRLAQDRDTRGQGCGAVEHYDAETGRFLQPDPVHTERAGFDNWDRYQYVNNNPVNFTDPTGESWLSDRFKGNWAKKIASGPLGKTWDRTIGKYGLGRWLHQRGVDRWLEGRHLDRWARASLKTAQRMTFVSKKRLNDFGNGLGMATVGILGLAASAVVLPAAVSVATVAVTAAINFSIAAITSACMLTSLFACTGYVLGGFGTSSLNNIHWNEKSARAGAFLGGAIHAVAAIAYTCYIFCSGLLSSLGTAVTNFGTAYIPGWNYIHAAWTYRAYASMVYDVVVGDGLSLGYSTLGLIFEKVTILQVPFFIWRGVAAGFHDIDQRYRDML